MPCGVVFSLRVQVFIEAASSERSSRLRCSWIGVGLGAALTRWRFLTFAVYVRCQYWCPGCAYISIDHEVYSSPESGRLTFQDVAPGKTVIVKHDYQTGEPHAKDWWMGQVIHCGGAARDPGIHMDSEVIRWVNS